MKRFAFASAVLALCALPLPTSYAATVHLSGTLLPSNEVPPTGSSGSGTALVDLDAAAQTLHVNIVFSGLVSPTSAAHIHCCLPSAFAVSNVGVATTVPAFAGFPLGVTSGTYDNTLDLTQSTSYNPAFVTAQGSLAAAEAALINGLLTGLTYLNIHTTQFPGGEIRGFIAAVPEPEIYLLLLAGLGLVGFVHRRGRPLKH